MPNTKYSNSSGAQAFYWPDASQPATQRQSPEYVQISTAAAITLKLVNGRMYGTPCTQCLNILVTYPEGCRANCSYCGLARHREESRDYATRNFIRVDWPTICFDDLLERVQRGDDNAQFQRMCISMITHPRSDADTMTLLKKWFVKLPHIPVSILSNPTSLQYHDLVAMKQHGADIFTVALDAVTPAIFERTRGKSVDSPHRWEKYWQVLEWAAEIFGREKFGAHLICGMGETEEELLYIAQRIRDMGGHNHMFAFFPEQGSLMQSWPAVPHDQWRRVQVARYLIDYRDVRVEDMCFDAKGRVINFGITENRLTPIVDSGLPFRTSGCPGNERDDVSACNRPYGDSHPSDILSYPFALRDQDILSVKVQLTRKHKA